MQDLIAMRINRDHLLRILCNANYSSSSLDLARFSSIRIELEPWAANRIAEASVLQTIFGNDGNQPLSYDLDDWRISRQGESLSLLTRERWDEIWEGDATGAVRIALRWSLLPSRKRFEPGDPAGIGSGPQW